MKAGIRTYLLADAAIDAAVTGVFSFPAKEGQAYPYIVLTRITASIENVIEDSVNVYQEAWQIDVYAAGDNAPDAEAETIKELVIGRLNTADRVQMGDYFVYSARLTFETDLTELETEGSEDAIIRKSMEFNFHRDREVTP